MQDKTLLSSKETAELLGVGVSTLYRYKKLSDFPKPIFFTNVTKNALKKMRSKPLLTKDKTRADHYHKGAKDEAPKTKI